MKKYVYQMISPEFHTMACYFCPGYVPLSLIKTDETTYILWSSPLAYFSRCESVFENFCDIKRSRKSFKNWS